MIRYRTKRASLFALAYVESLNAYRRAFQAGKLGQAPRDVADAIYGTAADVFRRRARGHIIAALGVFGVGLAFRSLSALLGADPEGWTDDVALILLTWAAIQFGRWDAWDDASRLLTPPERIEVADLVPDDPASGEVETRG